MALISIPSGRGLLARMLATLVIVGGLLVVALPDVAYAHGSTTDRDIMQGCGSMQRLQDLPVQSMARRGADSCRNAVAVKEKVQPFVAEQRAGHEGKRKQERRTSHHTVGREKKL